MKKLLVIDDEAEIVTFLKQFFDERKEYVVFTGTCPEEAFAILEKEKPDLMCLDVKLGSQKSGLDVLTKAKEISPGTKVIMISAVEDRFVIDQALKLGAVDYITKPMSLEYLERTVVDKLREAST
jgi:DNA-binding NtrC family response regulator